MQSAVQDHCQDCIGEQSLSDHHTFLDESGTCTLLTTLRRNTVLSSTILITEICIPLTTNENFFRFFPSKIKREEKERICVFSRSHKELLKEALMY